MAIDVADKAAERKSGARFVSSRIEAVPPSGIRRFFDIAATMSDVISLGIGEPDFVTPEPIVKAGIDSLNAGHTSYTSNSGILELRQLLSGQINKLYNLDFDPETELLVTVGVSEALMLALMSVLEAGDEVIVPEPCFVAYQPTVTFAGGKPVPVPTYVEQDFQVTVEDLEKARTRKTRAVLLGYPNNPTGAVLERSRLAEIAEWAERNDLIVVSDEIYDRLVYGIEHTCFAALEGMRERTILLGGFSKSYAMTGWRIGYAAAPPAMLAAMRKIHQYVIMSAPTTGQEAAIEALRSGEPFVEAMREEYDRRRRTIVHGFNRLGLDCFEPRGAFYAFPSIKSTGLSDADFSERLLMDYKVAMVPGSAFGESGAGHVRASYATSLPNIEEALNRIETFLTDLKK
ncbi:MAG TPA: aminotransferase class I/II-fold pyridoxal phosphate-dependent enzyme [Chloroflexia bacterium]|jgi:aminotransferase